MVDSQLKYYELAEGLFFLPINKLCHQFFVLFYVESDMFGIFKHIGENPTIVVKMGKLKCKELQIWW